VSVHAADAILLIHALLVAFNVGGLIGTWLGAWLGWRWVRVRTFRFVHLGAIGIVALGVLVGAACPLTRWEDALRGEAPAASFVARWVSWLLYWNPPPRVFTVLYVTWAAATLATLVLVPPGPRPVARRSARRLGESRSGRCRPEPGDGRGPASPRARVGARPDARGRSLR